MKKILRTFKIFSSYQPSKSQYSVQPIKYTIQKDHVTGIFGLDILIPKAMISWVIPALPAHTSGLLPHDIIIAIDNIHLIPGDLWPINYIMHQDLISLTIIPSNVIFENPKLTWTWVNHMCKHGNISTRTRQCVQTLSHKKQCVPINWDEEVSYRSHVYI